MCSSAADLMFQRLGETYRLQQSDTGASAHGLREGTALVLGKQEGSQVPRLGDRILTYYNSCWLSVTGPSQQETSSHQKVLS